MKLKFQSIALWAIVLSASLFPKTAFCSLSTNYSLPQFVEQADVICVGTTTAKQTAGKVDFQVEDVLKGNLTRGMIKIGKPRSSNGPGPSLELLPKLVAGERDIVFLEGDAAIKTFKLLHPANSYSPIISVGHTTFHNIAGLSPLRAVLSCLAQALKEDDKAMRLACLERIGQVNYLLYRPLEFEPTARWSDLVFDARQKLHEPGRGLEDFIKTSILPPVMNLTTTQDADVRVHALVTAADLQEVKVIPELVKLAHTKGFQYVSGVFRIFVVPEAVKPLMPLLQDENATVRDSAAYSLRWIGDPVTLPFLIDCLTQPDKVTYNMLAALQTIAGEHELMAINRFEEKKAEVIVFWKRWAAKHQDELKYLRSQLAS
jgi:hypothetical protein